jgi:RHS repeat-associated protein
VAGNVLNDGQNQYLYDAEGRICAVASSPVPSMTVMTGYLYDADGTRVAKGRISTWSCDPSPGANGFQTTNDYILGPSGEQVTEMGMGGTSNGATTSGLAWQHTNAWAAGNLLYDYIHHYTYDAENRIVTLDGQPTYIYDAEGRRVAKLGAGGSVTASYVLGLGGEQLSELNGAGQWVHSNVFAGGKLLATYAGPGDTSALGYHYHLTDWLGTQRMQANVNGNEEERCYSYPFGDGLNCTGSDATEHHFTSKERDAESGLDYFGARYLSSNLGRFMTPDWAAAPISVPYAQFGDPQRRVARVPGMKSEHPH